MEKSKRKLFDDEFWLNAMNELIKLEKKNGGPRTYWFKKGLATAASVAFFITVPQHRVLTGSLAAINIIDNVMGFGVLRWAENKVRKEQEEFLKKYPTPQAFIDDLLKKEKEPHLRVVKKEKDKEDLH